MCGIIFAYNPNESNYDLKYRVQSSLRQLHHRGPDEQNIIHADAFLGHTRLSIIDLSDSHQPMVDPHNRFFLTYNGEIYNYKALRKYLESDWIFKTQGDTEVLLAGLVTHGEKFINQLEGMWAFILWDSLEKKVLLSRDRIGKKPLYYFAEQNKIFATSELPALLKLIDFTPQEDMECTIDYFKYGYYLPGYTTYKNIFEILPGHYAIWYPQKEIVKNQYWSINYSTIEKKQTYDNTSKLKSLLTESVRKRMISDVPIGAFLSGGLDSSIICSIITNYLKKDLKTFSIGFKEKSFDERKYSTLVSNYLNTEHHLKVIKSLNHESIKILINEHIGQPFFDASIIPTAEVSKLAASQVKVILSGDGADELFSGYQRYQARVILQWYSCLPPYLKRNTEKVIALLPSPLAHHSRSIIKKTKLFIETLNRQNDETPYIGSRLFTNLEIKHLLGTKNLDSKDKYFFNFSCGYDDIHTMMFMDSLVYLPQDILLKVDRATMANSIEARCPFLDHTIIDFAFRTHIKSHRSLLSGKKILKSNFKHDLPQAIFTRRKQGFGSPVSYWFKSSLGSELSKMLQTNSVINSQFADQMINRHKLGQVDYGIRLWAIYTYLLWKNFHF
ncbi:asparagine synthase (glutamine-hydrolyzing) [Zooshikella sp. RANM57]|uniref:asparagine synthase (glutamine-hydrolyzing) n=1 Tax=Zooshikella sp. RANM57 TaxID=3425863 RepID=UPI003D6E3D2E